MRRRWLPLLLIAGCGDPPPPIVDARVVDAGGSDASAGLDAADLDAGPDAADPDAGSDAADLDAGPDAADLDAGPDAAEVDAAPDATPDAALTTQSAWEASSGATPDTGCAPWTLVDQSDPEAPALAAGQLTLGNDVDGELLYYLHPAAVLTMPPLLVIEARVRFATGASQTPSRTGASISYALGDSDQKNTLFIGDGVVFLLSAESTRGPAYVGPTTDAVHTYRLEVNTATHAITVLRDGATILTGTAFLSPYPVDTAIYFGEASIVARGTSHWAGVSHNALAPVACP